MSSIYYSAVWTDSGFFLRCSHEHETIGEANSCIPCAGGYVVAVEDGVMCSLTAAEEAECQLEHYARRTDNSAVETTPASLAEAAFSDPRYAVMIRIRVGDRWIWTTWMCFETYAEAAAHAREGNKVVRFRSPEWAALEQLTEDFSAVVIKAPQGSIPPQGQEETFLEFVLRFLDSCSFARDARPISYVKYDLIDTDMIDSVLVRLGEIGELERLYAEDKHALMKTLGDRFRTVLKPESEWD